MTIGVISDTHGVFSDEFREFLSPCDELWHAGDFGNGETAAAIAAFKPLVGVHGNCDGQDVRMDHPAFRFWIVDGVRILMTHIGGYPGHYDPRARELIEEYKPNVFVCGHSHILKVGFDKKYGMLCVNPGACGLQGWHVVRTALRFRIEDGVPTGMEVFNLERKTV